mgnify:CR=1 FL=1
MNAGIDEYRTTEQEAALNHHETRVLVRTAEIIKKLDPEGEGVDEAFLWKYFRKGWSYSGFLQVVGQLQRADAIRRHEGRIVWNGPQTTRRK